jgi:hypothetical protein
MYGVAASAAQLLQTYGHPITLGRLCRKSARFGGDLGVIITRNWLLDVFSSFWDVLRTALEWKSLYNDWKWDVVLEAGFKKIVSREVNTVHNLYVQHCTNLAALCQVELGHTVTMQEQWRQMHGIHR